jgi:hypothetical protein
MAWIWVVGVVGLCLGAGTLVDRRRYRGVSVPQGLSGREKRRAIRQARGEMARHEIYIPPSGYYGGGDGGV